MMNDSKNQTKLNSPGPRRQGTRRLRKFWQGASRKDRLVIVVGLVYLLSPIDIIPEAVLGVLGLADDGVVLLALARTVYAVARRRGIAPK